jgi:hypothetical protein
LAQTRRPDPKKLNPILATERPGTN